MSENLYLYKSLMKKEMFRSDIHVSINKRDPRQHIHQTGWTDLFYNNKIKIKNIKYWSSM